MEQITHRPGSLKQINKSHKCGKHLSKGMLSKVRKGRVNVVKITQKKKGELSKNERRNQLRQHRKVKREALLNVKRGGSGLHQGAPILVLVVPTSDQSCVESVVELLAREEECVTHISRTGMTNINVKRFRQRLCFVIPPRDRLFSILDSIVAADAVLFVHAAASVVPDPLAEYLVSTFFMHGLPTCVHCFTGAASLPLKSQRDTKRAITKNIEAIFPSSDLQLHAIDTKSDATQLLRFLSNAKLRSLPYRDCRPHILADDLAFTPNHDQPEIGTLHIRGFIRGAPGAKVDVNGLLHVTGSGNHSLVQILELKDPYALENHHRLQAGMVIDALSAVKPSLDLQWSLQSELEVNEMEVEEEWPTKEDFQSVDQEAKRVRHHKGTSAYQAAWLSEDEDLSGDDMDFLDSSVEAVEEEDSDVGMEEDESIISAPEERLGTSDECYDKTVDWSEDMEGRVRFQEQEAGEDDEFDDMKIALRIRLRKYRALESFRTSVWVDVNDPPIEYRRIFHFDKFNAGRKRVLRTALQREEEEGLVCTGKYVELQIKDVSKQFFESRNGSGFGLRTPTLVSCLLPHEQRMSLVHVVLKRTPCQVSSPIVAKTALVFRVGTRQFTACPIFSKHTKGNKHKYERYFYANGEMYVASFYAPVSFPPAPVLAFLPQSGDRLALVASGCVLTADTDRKIIKRVLLSGHPFKINKNVVVIRYMFNNREDVEYFKKVELRSKNGRKGSIREPLGTHGHMKCTFNGLLKSQDPIYMSLYKRVYPKWSFSNYSFEPAPLEFDRC